MTHGFQVKNKEPLFQTPPPPVRRNTWEIGPIGEFWGPKLGNPQF